MKGCKFSVVFVTGFLLVYTLSPYVGVPAWVISSAYLISPFLIGWMVVCVLKNGQPSGRTFDEGYFYDEESAPQSVDRERT